MLAAEIGSGAGRRARSLFLAPISSRRPLFMEAISHRALYKRNIRRGEMRFQTASCDFPFFTFDRLRMLT
jgi:hypothetical protein